MKLPSLRLGVLGATAALVLASPVSTFAQPRPLEPLRFHHRLDSGWVVNPGSVSAVVFDRVVEAAGAPWLRLTFGPTLLAPGSFLRLTSVADGAVQHLRRDLWHQWAATSAYFNGSAVRVELVAAPGSRNRVEVGDLYTEAPSVSPRSICGPTDDRAPSRDPARGRLLDIGCTASIYSVDSCFLTAGHCASAGWLLDVLEFNVPASDPDGTLRHPGPEDQYAVDRSSRVYRDNGPGNDWALFRVYPNTETGLLPYERQGARVVLSPSVPPVGDSVLVVGYGVDEGEANQIQQVSRGPVTAAGTNQLKYQADTQGGVSGAPVVWNRSGEVAAVHTNAGCWFGGGSNSGTSITNSGLQDQLATYCPAPPSIPCGEVVDLHAACQATPQGSRLEAAVLLADNSRDGEVVEINVDSSARPAQIDGLVARLTLQDPASGTHLVALANPPGCQTPLRVACP